MMIGIFEVHGQIVLPAVDLFPPGRLQYFQDLRIFHFPFNLQD